MSDSRIQCTLCFQTSPADAVVCSSPLCGENLARPAYNRPPGQWNAQRTMLIRDSIIVWRWVDAPAFLKALSSKGGDEDWLVMVPKHLANAYIGWLESQSFDAGADPQVIPLKEGLWVPAGPDDEVGTTIYIGSHA